MTNQIADQLHENIKKLLSFDKKSLIAREEWGELNFRNAEDELGNIFAILSHLNSLPIYDLPAQILSGINTVLNNVKNNFDSINNFNIKLPNPVAARDALQNQVQTNAKSLFDHTYSYISYLMVVKNDSIGKLNQSLSEITTLQHDSEKKYEEIKKSLVEIKSIVASAREATLEVGVGHFAEVFANEANICASKSNKWLWTTTILAFLTLLSAWCFIFLFDNYDVSKYIQFATSKIAFILMLLTTSIWCGKIYKSWMHLSHVNKHKANALKTFLAFSKATDDNQTKNAVLIEAAHCIFGTSNTGLLAGQEPFEQTKFFEIFKGIEK